MPATRGLQAPAAIYGDGPVPATKEALAMLYAFGFGRIGVLVSDLYFVNPDPEEGQEGPEQGVRLELRVLDRDQLRGSIYSAQPISVGRPLWRADLLESVEAPGSLDRAHHHPRFQGWEPGSRHFVDELTADPLRWVGEQLSDLDGLLEGAGVAREEVDGSDGVELRHAVPEILGAVQRLLDGVRTGDRARPPGDEQAVSARVGWL